MISRLLDLFYSLPIFFVKIVKNSIQECFTLLDIFGYALINIDNVIFEKSFVPRKFDKDAHPHQSIFAEEGAKRVDLLSVPTIQWRNIRQMARVLFPDNQIYNPLPIRFNQHLI